jgi:hypothetical protein
MDIFQRSIHSNVKKTDDDHLQVNSSMLDLEHSIHLELTVCLSTRMIESAKATMTKVPLTQCYSAIDGLSQIEGLPVGRGIIKEIRSRLGGPKSCTHLVELLTDAVRLISMLLIGLSLGYQPNHKTPDEEEEIIALGKVQLRNTCLVFANE